MMPGPGLAQAPAVLLTTSSRPGCWASPTTSWSASSVCSSSSAPPPSSPGCRSANIFMSLNTFPTLRFVYKYFYVIKYFCHSQTQIFFRTQIFLSVLQIFSVSRSAGCCCSRSCCSPCCPPHQSSPSGLNTFKFPIFILSLSSINKYHNQGDGVDGWPILLHLHDGQRDLRPVRHLQAAAPPRAARHPHPAVHPPPQVCIYASL